MFAIRKLHTNYPLRFMNCSQSNWGQDRIDVPANIIIAILHTLKRQPKPDSLCELKMTQTAPLSLWMDSLHVFNTSLKQIMHRI